MNHLPFLGGRQLMTHTRDYHDDHGENDSAAAADDDDDHHHQCRRRPPPPHHHHRQHHHFDVLCRVPHVLSSNTYVNKTFILYQTIISIPFGNPFRSPSQRPSVAVPPLASFHPVLWVPPARLRAEPPRKADPPSSHAPHQGHQGLGPTRG